MPRLSKNCNSGLLDDGSQILPDADRPVLTIGKGGDGS